MNEDQFNTICSKLDKIAAIISVQEIDDKNKKIKILKNQGLTSKQIGDILGTDKANIRKYEGWKK